MNKSLFAAKERMKKFDQRQDPLQIVDRVVDFAELARKIDRICPRPKGGGSPYPTELMIRILVIKNLWDLSDDRVEYLLLDRTSFQRFTGLQNSPTVPDAKTIRLFCERLSKAGADEVFFSEYSRQIKQAGYNARGGRLIDATLVDAPVQRGDRQE